MAIVNWVGGTSRVGNAGIWTPSPPVASGDIGAVTSGHVVAINQTVGPYSIDLEGGYANATFDSVGGTLTGTIGSFLTFDSDGYGGGGAGTVGLAGANTNTGSIETTAFYMAYGTYGIAGYLHVEIGDVASPDGTVIQQGVLTNTGDISAGSDGAIMAITGASADAKLVNNGEIDVGSQLNLDVAVTGTGVITIGQGIRDLYFEPGITFGKAVGAGQTVNILNAPILLDDPLDFRATIGDFHGPYVGFGEIEFAQTTTTAAFLNHTLTLMNGNTLVAQFKFTSDVIASDIVVASTGGQTQVFKSSGVYGPLDGVIPIATSGSVPSAPPIVLPGPLVYLPSSGPDITLASGAKLASTERLQGYTIHLEGTMSSNPPLLAESSTTFGASFALHVDGAGAASRFGGLDAVGYNENDGTIVATTASGGGGGTLLINVSDVISPDGVVILAGAYNNLGTISAAHGSTIDITGTADSKLINAGTVNAQGMMFIAPTVTGTGTMTIGSQAGTAGSLELGGYVATGQTINLLAGTLTIDNAPHFFATITSFLVGDHVVLKGVDVSGVTYNNGALLLDGGAAGTLHFHRPAGVSYDTSSFNLAHTGGDTIITTHATH